MKWRGAAFQAEGTSMHRGRLLLGLGALTLLVLAGVIVWNHFPRRSPDLGQGPAQDKGHSDDGPDQRLIRRLDDLPLTGASYGGPHKAVVANETTTAIVAKGPSIVPLLIANLDRANVDGTIFTIYCLRDLRATSAKAKIQELQAALRRGERFADVRRDLTLEVQIDFFLRDVDSW
jgi:hypothetical protein